MKITDGKKTVEIKIMRWNGSGYDPDWSIDYFEAGSLEQNEDGAYIVCDVDYCIDMAKDDYSEEGACYGDPDMNVFVTEL